MCVKKRYDSRVLPLNGIVASRFAVLKKRKGGGEVGGGRDGVMRKKYAIKKKEVKGVRCSTFITEEKREKQRGKRNRKTKRGAVSITVATTTNEHDDVSLPSSRYCSQNFSHSQDSKQLARK